MKVIPAIIPEDMLDLHNKLLRFKNQVPLVQIDVCDGRLTGKASWPYANDKENFFEKIREQEEGLPMWEFFDFEIDLMVRNPEKEFERWIDAGATRLVVHHASGMENRVLEMKRECDLRGTEVIVAFHQDHDLADFEKYKGEINELQLMGINRIGFQGQQFEEVTISLVEDMRNKYPDLQIGVDGGVNFDSAERLADAGVDYLIIGSALNEGAGFEENLDYFESL
jgi:ribulose-phosphate 3-epimerase